MVINGKTIVGQKGKAGRKSDAEHFGLIDNINKYEPRFWELMNRFSTEANDGTPQSKQRALEKNKIFISTMAKFLDKMMPTIIAGDTNKPLEVNITTDEQRRIANALDSIIGFAKKQG